MRFVPAAGPCRNGTGGVRKEPQGGEWIRVELEHHARRKARRRAHVRERDGMATFQRS